MQPLPVDVDLTRLAQVVTNLLEQRRQVHARIGRIAIRTRSGSNGDAAIEVKDNGAGIPRRCAADDLRSVRPVGPDARRVAGRTRHRPDAGQAADRDARRHRRSRRATGAGERQHVHRPPAARGDAACRDDEPQTSHSTSCRTACRSAACACWSSTTIAIRPTACGCCWERLATRRRPPTTGRVRSSSPSSCGPSSSFSTSGCRR